MSDAETPDNIIRERRAVYGDPAEVYGLVHDLRHVLDKWGFKKLPGAVQELIMMAMTKVARIVIGQYKADNYIDCGNYFHLAGEVHGRGKPKEE